MFDANESTINDINTVLATDQEMIDFAKDVSENIFKKFADTSVTVDADASINIENFLKSNAFVNIIIKLKNGFSQGIRSSMLDKYGNIMNFSLPNEVAHLTSKLVFRKRI